MNEDVFLPSSDEGVRLSGTLTFTTSPKAAALLLPGSGPQDRDETLAGQKPFRVLASHLADMNIASLRCDDRGVGGSGGDYLAIDETTLLADALAQLRWLRRRIPDLPIAVIGHSQGALFALRLAGAATVDRTILLGAAIRPGFESMMGMREQMATDAGLADEDRAMYLTQSRELFEAIASIDDDTERRRVVSELTVQSVAGAGDSDFQPDFESIAEYIEFAVADAMEWEVRALLRSDPGSDLAVCSTPALALWGSHDRHLDPDVESAAFAAHAPHGSQAEILDGFNHLFQRSNRGVIDDYATDGEPMCRPVAERIAGWLSH